ncbi:MAG TPA: hypothetical protein VGL16_13190 [Actinomycetota bacterium]
MLALALGIMLVIAAGGTVLTDPRDWPAAALFVVVGGLFGAVGDQGLHWVPGGRLCGGQAFELRGGDIERIQVSSVGVRSTGLIVTTSEQGEAWLLLHRSDVTTLLMTLRGHDQLAAPRSKV